MAQDKYKTILVIVTGLMLIGIPAKHHWVLYVAAALAIICLLFPVIADWIVKGWYKLAEGLGWLNSRILLSVIFYLFLCPLAFISRLTAKNALNIKKTEDNENSTFEIREHQYIAEDLENVW